MTLTKVSRAMQSGECVSVIDYGADSTGSVDCTTEIQAAIDTGKSVYFPAGTYIVAGLTIADKSFLSYFSDGDATLTNVGTTKTGPIFKFSGECSSLGWYNLKIVGDTTVDSNNAAFGCPSGQTGRDFIFRDLFIQDVCIGISLNADLSGAFYNCMIESCQFKDIVGEAPGEGYAVHMSNAFDTFVSGCFFSNVGRHEVYTARGGNVTITDCRSVNHRMDTYTGATRPAISIARSSNNCIVSNCSFSGYYDSAIGVTGDSTNGLVTQNVIISNCTFKNPQNQLPAIFVGEQQVISSDTVDGVIIEGCTFYSDVDASNASGFLNVFNGKNVMVRDCFIRSINQAANFTPILIGNNVYSANQGDCENISVENCVFHGEGTSGQYRAVVSEGYMGSNVDKTLTVNNTQFQIDAALTLLTWHSASYGYANTGVQGTGRFGNIGRGVGTAAPTAGTWNKGDVVWNISPSAGGTIGWVCTTAGTPGTWKTFGTIAV